MISDLRYTSGRLKFLKNKLLLQVRSSKEIIMATNYLCNNYDSNYIIINNLLHFYYYITIIIC